MALGYETLREIEREEMARSKEICASNENRRKENEAKEKKRPFNESERVSSEMRADLPRFRPGDTLKVHAKVVEGDKERIQIFRGVVLQKHPISGSMTITIINPLKAICIENNKRQRCA